MAELGNMWSLTHETEKSWMIRRG